MTASHCQSSPLPWFNPRPCQGIPRDFSVADYMRCLVHRFRRIKAYRTTVQMVEWSGVASL